MEVTIEGHAHHTSQCLLVVFKVTTSRSPAVNNGHYSILVKKVNCYPISFIIIIISFSLYLMLQGGLQLRPEKCFLNFKILMK